MSVLYWIVEFNNASCHNLILTWKNDDINKLIVDKDKIKYKVEMRKESGEFIQVYEGNDLKCTINNLEFETNYEFRICIFYNNIIGQWSQIQKIKTLEIDSSILNGLQKKIYF